MQVDEQMDHGAIVAQEFLPLTTQTFLELRDQTAELGVKLLVEKLPQWLTGQLKSMPQDDSEATYTKKIEKQDGELKEDDDALTNWRKIRAYTPWPGAFFFQDAKRVIIKKARLQGDELIIERVTPEGKSEMDYSDFLKNQPSNSGR